MTALEAFEKVEAMLTALKIRDKFGEPVHGQEAIGLVNKYEPEALARLETLLETGAITPAEYCEGMGKLLERFKAEFFANRLDLRLGKAMAG